MQVLITTASIILLLISIAPLNRLPWGVVRVLDFPRPQIFLIAAITFVLAFIYIDNTRLLIGVSVAAGAALLIQAYRIARYLPVSRKTSFQADPDKPDLGSVSLLSLNVKQSNRHFDIVAKMIRDTRADMVILMEVNQLWLDELRGVLAKYHHCVEHPLDNSYGIALYSMLPLKRKKLRFLINEEIPSIDCLVQMSSGKVIRLFCLHPEPPVPHRDTKGRDAEILRAGLELEYEELPVIVAGDLNDVAWSSTTHRFLRVSGLLDPREGRGFFNTFDARIPLMRWPLDHVFHSRHFRFKKMTRLPFVGSDHFPIYCKLVLTGDANDNGPSQDASNDDKKEADGLIEEEKGKDRRPIGVDWES